VPRKFAVRQALFNNVRPALGKVFGLATADRLLKTGAVDTLLQLLFFKNSIASKPPGFFVLKKKDSLVYTIDAGTETRQSLALHRELLNVKGPHISIAYMQPHYRQRSHFQSRTPEHNLLVNGLQALHAGDPGNERLFNGDVGDIFYVPPLMQHTISNATSNTAVNCMVKPFFERRSFLDNTSRPSGGPQSPDNTPHVLKGTRHHFDWGTMVVHHIKTVGGFSYTISLLTVLPEKEVSLEMIKGRKPESEEALISFGANSTVRAISNDGRNNLELELGDTLYVHNQPYTIRNESQRPAVLVRAVVTN
jgi:uncharacterized RmlC-like cupin family protein